MNKKLNLKKYNSLLSTPSIAFHMQKSLSSSFLTYYYSWCRLIIVQISLLLLDGVFIEFDIQMSLLSPGILLTLVPVSILFTVFHIDRSVIDPDGLTIFQNWFSGPPVS